MNNNKTTNILLGILIIVLIAIGIIMTTNQNRNSYRNDMMRNDDSRIDDQSNALKSVKTTTERQDSTTWSSNDGITIEKLDKNQHNDVYLKESVDLTGDGVPEAVFGASDGGAAAAAIAWIAAKDSNGKISLLNMKEKSGSTHQIYLAVTGSSSYNSYFKLVPEVNGFYTIDLQYDEASDKLACTTDSAIQAYQWNPKTSLFEYNSTLTAKYTAIECK